VAPGSEPPESASDAEPPGLTAGSGSAGRAERTPPAGAVRIRLSPWPASAQGDRRSTSVWG